MKTNTILFAAALAILCSCNPSKQAKSQVASPSGAPVREIQVMTVQKSQIEVSQKFSADIEGRQAVEVFAQVSGKIEKVCFSEGQTVCKGQTLFVIDQAPYIAAARIAAANVNSAEVMVQTQAMNLEGKEVLYKEGVVSEYELKLSKNAFQKAQADLEQAKAAKLKADTDLGYTTVKSPCDGVAGMIPFREGALVGPQTPEALTQVADTKTMYVYFSVGQTRYRELVGEYGSKVQFLKEFPAVELILNDGTRYARTGKIEAVSGVLNPDTGTVTFRAVFPNPDGFLLSGSKGNVVMPRVGKDVFVVPSDAVFEIQGKYFVQKIQNGVATTTEVQPLEWGNVQNGTSFVIRGGIEAGDIIAARNAGLIKNGETVKICQ